MRFNQLGRGVWDRPALTIGKTATTGIPDGRNVHEVLVVEVALKAREVPGESLASMARANPHKLLFVCIHEDEACLAVMLSKLIVGPWRETSTLALGLNAANIDKVWDALAPQTAFGDMGMEDVTAEERFAVSARLKVLHEERDGVEARCRKERQLARKNELFRQMRALEKRIEEMERDEIAS